MEPINHQETIIATDNTSTYTILRNTKAGNYPGIIKREVALMQVTLNTRVSVETAYRLDTHIKKVNADTNNRISKASVVELAIKEYLDRQEKGDKKKG